MKGGAKARVGPTAISSLIAALAFGAHTFDQLSSATGLPTRSVSAWVDALRQAKLVHVAKWLPDSRGYFTIAAFIWGPNELDATKPTMTGTERNRAWRQRQKDAEVCL